ncbi:MAG: glycosyltransferase [Pseudomonadota bacterium]|nr:glycosyltransferase [Pseudomonadota bacterium]
MIAGEAILAWLDAGVREATLFAAVGFLCGGIDDLVVDMVYLWAIAIRRKRPATPTSNAAPRHFAIFVAAWDEAAVIGSMLGTALARLVHDDYAIHVGTYPNDPGTIAAVGALAAHDPRVRLVIGDVPGPTTKADCLNTIWAALRRAEGDGATRAEAIVIHDAEDVVHPRELQVFEALLDNHAVVQLPVLPLIDHRSRLVSGHYADEFAEAHAKGLIVREALGVGMPLAGVGCAVSRAMIDELATRRGGTPFDAASLTEDYELGLMIGRLGGRAALARERDPRDDSLIAVRAYFPTTIEAAVRQNPL